MLSVSGLTRPQAAAAVAAAPWGRVNPGPMAPPHATAFVASARGAAVAALWCVSGRGRVVLACGPLRDLRTAGDVGLMTWPGRYSSARAAVSVPQATGKQKPQRSVREGAAVAGPSRPHKKTPPPQATLFRSCGQSSSPRLESSHSFAGAPLSLPRAPLSRATAGSAGQPKEKTSLHALSHLCVFLTFLITIINYSLRPVSGMTREHKYN